MGASTLNIAGLAEAVPAVREIAVRVGPVTLSGLLAEPVQIPPRALIVAIHGGGMRAGYFHGQAHPSLSLLTLGSRLGYTVVALDRPGYGESAAALPRGQKLADQADVLCAALEHLGRRRATAGILLVGHSYGGKLALSAAADDRIAPLLLGVDVSGTGHRYAVSVEPDDAFHSRQAWALHWGPVGLYPPDTFRLAASVVCGMPEVEQQEARNWPDRFPGVAAGVRVPVRLTFAQYERWWQHDDAALAVLAEMFAGSKVVIDRLPDAGHNISLGWAARTYHLRVLSFLEQCISA
jgi:pimeloyl-ACP methyl ester carboxylesterase